MEAKDKHPIALVIEDDPGHQRMLEIRIKRNGCDCECTFDGKSGLQKALNTPYDILFVDINIPEMDGFMVAASLRESGCVAPLIAVTALKLEGLERQAMAIGFNDFLRKPIEQDVIGKILDRYVFAKSAKTSKVVPC